MFLCLYVYCQKHDHLCWFRYLTFPMFPCVKLQEVSWCESVLDLVFKYLDVYWILGRVVHLYKAQWFSLNVSLIWILSPNCLLCIYGWCNWYSWEEGKGKRPLGTYDGGRRRDERSKWVFRWSGSISCKWHAFKCNLISKNDCAFLMWPFLTREKQFKLLQYETRFMLWKAICKAISNIQTDQNLPNRSTKFLPGLSINPI